MLKHLKVETVHKLIDLATDKGGQCDFTPQQEHRLERFVRHLSPEERAEVAALMYSGRENDPDGDGFEDFLDYGDTDVTDSICEKAPLARDIPA